MVFFWIFMSEDLSTKCGWLVLSGAAGRRLAAPGLSPESLAAPSFSFNFILSDPKGFILMWIGVQTWLRYKPSSVYEMSLLREGCHKELRQMQVTTAKYKSFTLLKLLIWCSRPAQPRTQPQGNNFWLQPILSSAPFHFHDVQGKVLDWEPGNLGPCCYSASLAWPLLWASFLL